MTRTRTRLDYSGRFSRINDTKSVKKGRPLLQAILSQILGEGEKNKKRLIENSDKAISKDKVSFNHQPNRT